jgi:hypothetical protein
VGQWDTVNERNMYLALHCDGGTVGHAKRE